MDLSIYVDESGILAKSTPASPKYFIIAFVITNNSEKLKKEFKNSRLKAVKNKKKYLEQLKNTHEIKATDISENYKISIYEKLIEKCSDCFEIGFIVVDNDNLDSKFKEVRARSFNFLLKSFLSDYFINHSKFCSNGNLIQNINFIIDEQNVATKSKYTLNEYLNTAFLDNPITEKDITVTYSDSKNVILIQLADFLANTSFRHFQHHQPVARDNMNLLMAVVCGNTFYGFPYSVFKDQIKAYNNSAID